MAAKQKEKATAVTGDIVAGPVSKKPHAASCNYEGGANCTCGADPQNGC